jgi:hypothetical protein
MPQNQSPFWGISVDIRSANTQTLVKAGETRTFAVQVSASGIYTYFEAPPQSNTGQQRGVPIERTVGARIESVRIRIEQTGQEFPAEQNASTKYWECQVPTANQTAELTIVATATATVTVKGEKRSGTGRSTQACLVVPKSEELFESWERVELRCRSEDFSRGLQARTADPLWLLTRQWQTGEFEGEDTGSPIEAAVNYSQRAVAGGYLGADAQKGFSLSAQPLEMAVEQEYLNLDWRRRVQIGQRFERAILAALGVKAAETLAVYREKYPLQLPTGAEWDQIDWATRQFLALMIGRVVDGGKLLKDIQDKSHQIPSLGELQKRQLNGIVDTLRQWCQALNIQPTAAPSGAWRPQQLDYRFQLDDDRLLAPSYRHGDLDWHAFNLRNSKDGTKRTYKTHPTRVSVAGNSPRWWAFEDAALDFGRLEVDTTDLVRLSLMQFVLLYGDDWFDMPFPVDLTVLGQPQLIQPQLIRIDNLTISNVFGEKITLSSAQRRDDNPLLRWEIFTHSVPPDPQQPWVGDPDKPGPDPDVRLILPTTFFSQESPPLEEVIFLRDEGANMVWAEESKVVNGLGQPVDGFEAQQERQIREGQTQGQGTSAFQLTAPRYRLASDVSENWIPFIPAKQWLPDGNYTVRLRRGQMLSNIDAGKPAHIRSMSRLLALDDAPLLWPPELDEEIVPRSGLRIQLTAQRARGIDGKTYVWLGRKILPGRGEDHSNLRFDLLVPAEN